MHNCPKPDRNRLTDDPLMYGLLISEFDAVYSRLLASSKVSLSDEYRISVRRTVFDALDPRIREVSEEGKVVHGIRVKGFDDFRSWVSAEMRRLIEEYQRGGVFDQLI